MADVGLVLDPIFETHDTGPDHPERPQRLAAIRERLSRDRLIERCRVVAPVTAETSWITAVHDASYVRRVDEACAAGDDHIDTLDVAISPESARVARVAAGSLVTLCEGVAEGRFDRGLAIVRPPGHHAERNMAMGFCLFNNIAIAARHLIEAHGRKRVLIVDWDVHHGNGTQHLFEDRADVFYFSLHQYPLYPGTGRASETGRGAGEGTTLNCPLPPGAGDAEFLGALRERMVPAADAFQPEFVLVSAGFDAHRDDPLGGMVVSTGAFAEATKIVLDVAVRHAGGKLVASLEGGYDLEALAASTSAVLTTLLDEP